MQSPCYTPPIPLSFSKSHHKTDVRLWRGYRGLCERPEVVVCGRYSQSEDGPGETWVAELVLQSIHLVVGLYVVPTFRSPAPGAFGVSRFLASDPEPKAREYSRSYSVCALDTSECLLFGLRPPRVSGSRRSRRVPH